MTPTNTPVSLPRRVATSMPARSNASQDVSSSSRCCGSVDRASRGEMPNIPASKSAKPSRNPPRRVTECPIRSGSGSYNPATSQPRSAGNSPVASTRSATSRHRSSGERTPPGNRHAMATTAIGSADGAGLARGGSAELAEASRVSSAMTAPGVGKS